MTKYDEQFKLRLVKQYLSGKGGTEALARRHGVQRSALRRWVSAYKAHGRHGLRKKFGAYDERFKLSVLNRMRKESLSQERVAAIFGIRSPGSIAQWERRYHEGGINALAPRARGRRKAMTRETSDQSSPKDAADERTREQLLKETEYSRAEVAYLKKLDALLLAKKQGVPAKKRK